ncbi:response regulator [Porphyromonas gingivalis]|uniref:response regulator transcription factor n=1 Tax=Porphyromonas gingivalis TaxID=837 RepID=UPI000C17ACEF|nr:response regulator transcription factor [Porphyromonas gingivalis]ATR98644.1 hypothetical protein CS550_05350 [Porphyromonas gingivalis]
MKKKKILIFEDEWDTIKGSFEMANIYAFDGCLDFDVKAKSQEASFEALKSEYALVFIDITLAKNTHLDGYNILKKIKEERLMDLNKVVILTGNSEVTEKLKEIGTSKDEITIVYKPFDFSELSELLKGLLQL